MVNKKFKILSFFSLVLASVAFVGNINTKNNTEIVEAADATNSDTYYSSLYDSSGNLKYTGSTLKTKLKSLLLM